MNENLNTENQSNVGGPLNSSDQKADESAKEWNDPKVLELTAVDLTVKSLDQEYTLDLGDLIGNHESRLT